MQLLNLRVEVGCERRRTGPLEVPHRHDDVVRVEPQLAGDQEKTPALSRDALDAHAKPYRQRKFSRVGFEIVGHFVLGREGKGCGRKGHAVQAVEPRRCKEPKRIPPVPPGVTDPLAGVQNHERHTHSFEVISDGQARLPSAHHHRIHALHAVCLTHGVLSFVLPHVRS